MTSHVLNFEEVRHLRMDGLHIGALVIMPHDQFAFGDPIGTVKAVDLVMAIGKRELLTNRSCQPQLAAYLFALTRKPRLMNHYFPITHALERHDEVNFHRLIVSIAQNPNFEIQLMDEKRQDRSPGLPPDAGYLVAGHIAEVFFYRRDLLDEFLNQRRGFFLYTTPQAFNDDGGVSGGCYNPQRDAIQLVLSRLYEGFSAPMPGVAPFIHEFGHMLDHASGSRGLIPGMDEFLDLFWRGKQTELERYERQRSQPGSEPLPIGHPYVFQNNGEFIAGYLEMFFRNPQYFAAQNADLFQAFAQCLGQDPRKYWKVDFPYYVKQNRDYYLAASDRPHPGSRSPSNRGLTLRSRLLLHDIHYFAACRRDQLVERDREDRVMRAARRVKLIEARACCRYRSGSCVRCPNGGTLPGS